MASSKTKSKKPRRDVTRPTALSSSGTELIDQILFNVGETGLMEQLEAYLVNKAPEIVDPAEFCAALAHYGVLEGYDILPASQPKKVQVEQAETAIQVVCSKGAIRILILALQSSNNEGILKETCKWLKTSQERKWHRPIDVTSRARGRSMKTLSSTFFEQTAHSDELSKLATFECEHGSATEGISLVQFDKERMIACCAEGTLNLWNWQDRDERPILFEARVKRINCFQYDEEILVLGTGSGTVYLFDARSLKSKSSLGLGAPVIWLKFLESKLLVITRSAYTNEQKLWMVDISRTTMQLQKQLSSQMSERSDYPIPGVCMDRDNFFKCINHFAIVCERNSMESVKSDHGPFCCLKAPARISTLIVGDLIPTKRVVVAGCINAVIVMWNTSKFMFDQEPNKTLRGHNKEVISLCFLKGNLLSLDKSGQLLMWSGRDLESNNITPAPRMLIENSNFTSLVAHERWFALCSSHDDFIKIWTVPDSWLLTD